MNGVSGHLISERWVGGRCAVMTATLRDVTRCKPSPSLIKFEPCTCQQKKFQISLRLWPWLQCHPMRLGADISGRMPLLVGYAWDAECSACRDLAVGTSWSAMALE